MEPALPHSQASATRPYPGLAQSSPHTHNPPPADPLAKESKLFIASKKFNNYSV